MEFETSANPNLNVFRKKIMLLVKDRDEKTLGSEKNISGSVLTRLKTQANNKVLQSKKVDLMLNQQQLNDLTHEELVVEIATHQNKQAFRILFDHYAPRIKSYLLRFKINDEKAEGLTQEVMIVLWRKAKQFDAEKAKLSTWLFRVARNKFIDFTRKKKYPEVNADDHLNHMVAEEKSDGGIIQSQNAHRIKEAMKGLKPEQKKVIELSFYEELSHGQIAEKLDLPLGTVKSRIRQAFKILREQIGAFE